MITQIPPDFEVITPAEFLDVEQFLAWVDLQRAIAEGEELLLREELLAAEIRPGLAMLSGPIAAFMTLALVLGSYALSRWLGPKTENQAVDPATKRQVRLAACVSTLLSIVEYAKEDVSLGFMTNRALEHGRSEKRKLRNYRSRR